MLTKVEISGFLLGITAVCFELIVLFNRQYAPTYLLEFFRGGNTGGVIVGLALILGFISVVVFIINMFVGNRAKWPIRLVLLTTFIFSSTFLGSYV